EVAEVILVGEAGAANLRSRGELAHLGHFLLAERTVEGLELVVLILAHGSDSGGAGFWGNRRFQLTMRGEKGTRASQGHPPIAARGDGSPWQMKAPQKYGSG